MSNVAPLRRTDQSKASPEIVRAEHLCLRMRGATKRGADMVTSAFRGEFERNRALRAEALALLQQQRGAC